MWYNGIMLWLLQSPLHGMLSRNMMVINYTGRKSGKVYRLPISYKKIDEILLTVSYKHRTWWRNLRGGDKDCFGGQIRQGGSDTMRIHGYTLGGDLVA